VRLGYDPIIPHQRNTMMYKVIHTALDILFPPHCAGCGSASQALCASCARATAYLGKECFFCAGPAEKNNICGQCSRNHDFESIIWLWRYQNEKARTIIAAYKYKRKSALALPLARLLSQKLREHNIPRDIVVIPVPLHKNKERERGFNQAALIAKNLGLYSLSTVAVRLKETSPQAWTESRRERFKHMENVFLITRPETVQNKDILIIDDVATTGATLSELARVLKKAGAAKIYAAVLAHG